MLFSRLLYVIATCAFVAITTVSLSACGGGGGSSGTDPHLNPDGQGAPPPPEEAAAKLEPGSTGEFGELFMLHAQIARAMLRELQVTNDWKDNGAHGGDLSISGEASDTEAETRAISFTNFTELGVLPEARTVFNGDGEVTQVEDRNPELVFDGLLVEQGGVEYTVHGNIEVSRLAVELDLFIESGGKRWASRRFRATSVIGERGVREFITFAGRLEETGNGFVEVDTVMPAEVRTEAYYPPEYSAGGIFHLSGADGARVVVDLSDGYVGTVGIDANSDGFVESAKRFEWTAEEFDWSSDGLRSLPIAFARHEDLRKAPGRLGEPVELDGRLSIGKSGTLSTYAWEMWHVPSGSAAELQHPDTANPVFSPDVMGTYIVALHVSADGKTATDVLSIEVYTDAVISWEGMGSSFSASIGDVVNVAHPVRNYSWGLRPPITSNAVALAIHHSSTSGFIPDIRGYYEINGLLVDVDVDHAFHSPQNLGLFVAGIEDVDGDGIDDRIISNSTLPDPNGPYEIIYSADPHKPGHLPHPATTEAVDFDGDGRLEFIGRNFSGIEHEEGEISILFADENGDYTIKHVLEYTHCGIMKRPFLAQLPDGTFSMLTTTPCEADPYRAWKWSSSGFVRTTEIQDDVTPYDPRSIYLDFNGDGLVDIASIDWGYLESKGIALWKGKADNTYEQVAYLPTALALGLKAEDLDNDGRDELLLRNGPEPGETLPLVVLFRSPENSGLSDGQVLYRQAINEIPSELSVIDFNGDGLLDIVFSLRETAVFISQQPDGSFGEAYSLDTRAAAHEGYSLVPVQSFDFNQDGLLDLIINGRQVVFGKH